MTQITSRKQLMKWLKAKPTDHGQVIAARTALRTLPYLYDHRSLHKWANEFALSLTRATLITWAARNFPAHNMFRAATDAYLAAARAYAAFDDAAVNPAVNAVYAAVDVATDDHNNSAPYYVEGEIYTLADAIVADAASAATTIAAAADAMWDNINYDCHFLIDAAFSSSLTDARRLAVSLSVLRHLTFEPLWPDGKPNGWDDAWASTSARLANLDQGYDVWIDWYNRRIEGHDAAFDIPGDIDRAHDKAILARLADATDEDFWGKGATYVNTTLQGWIDEARIEARLEAATAEIQRGAIPDYSRPEASAARTEALREIDRLLVEPSDPRLKIGGNQPPEDIDPEERPVVLPPAVRDSIIAIKDDLQANLPDAAKIAEKSKLLLRLIKWRADIADVTGEHFAKGFGEEFGKQVAGDVYKLVRLAVLGLLAIIALFLSRSLGLMF